jgi:ferredoxin
VPTITFLPSGVTIDVKAGTTVFHAAERAEVAIASQCGGKCACALCRVCVITAQPAVSPMRWEEEGHLGNAFFVTRERLSCRLQVFGDITVEVAPPPHKDKKARYIPYSIIRKREKLEREDDQRRATARSGAEPQPRPRRGEPAPSGRPPKKRGSRRRRGRWGKPEGA